MSLDRLLKLAESPGIDAADRKWLQTGISALIDGESLESGLNVRCEESQVFEVRRDKHLRRAAKHIEATSPWQLAITLSQEVKRFESVIWPRWRLKPEPPAGASQLRKHLFFARREKRLPESIRQLYRILVE